MEENYYGHDRLPKNIEEVFFKSKEGSDTIAMNLVSYARKSSSDDLDVEQEEVIKKSHHAVVQYVHHLASMGRTVNDDILNSLKGQPNCLAKISISVGRLASELEAEIKHPEYFVEYVGGIRSKDSSFTKSNKYRIIELEQEVFLSGRFHPKEIAEYAVQYANVVGELPAELENLLKGHGPQVLKYANILSHIDKKISDDLLDSIAGDSNSLFEYANSYLRKRLPVHLERTMSDPKTLLNYARRIVRGRLPEELENHFANDYRFASEYAFEVIRGFACVRLPEVVHSAMVMKSFEIPNDSYIKRYISECEKDTTISGSWD
jgi:hypothetical protein